MADTYEFLDYTGLSEYTEYIMAKLIENSVTATATDGATYTATVDGLSALTPGAVITIKPSMTATSTTPTLNVNSLGAKQIRRKLSGGTLTRPNLLYANVVYKDLPLLLMYDGTYWVATHFTKPSATDLYGMVGVPNGGTGLESVTAGNFLIGNGTEDLVEKTPAEALVALGLTATAAELNYVDGVTSNIQDQFESTYKLTSAGTGITSSADLNNYMTPGIYYATVSVAASLSNCPTGIGFKMVVEYGYTASTRIIQTLYTGIAEGDVYRRFYAGSAWGTWRRQLSDILDSTDYGTTLPSTATAGRIFFKKVT